VIRALLIANRGEIARRIIRACRKLGVRAVAVYSDADADALHVTEADAAVRIGPAPARDSYLSITAIIAAAKHSGADAVHPGYGFLSENAEFAEACLEAGLIFVGPSPEAIRAMGEKDRAKEIVAQAGVPVLPGGDEKSAKRVGYPLLIKPVAGGGGRGLRLVRAAGELKEACAAARREAEAAFGDGRLMLEKYLEHPRHVEVQVLADAHGNFVHLFERDCSIQRRHQKMIEEAPAPNLPDTLRRRMHEAALAAARAVDYAGVGTVEFLVAGDDFYFAEMNTRLQVEHPVTEMVTGLDLVDWQIRVASGERLTLRQDDIAVTGHAIEARLYAEDPARDYLPSIGTLHAIRFPDETHDVRIDSGVRAGDAVTPHYDAMIAKLVVHGANRPQAVVRLRAALADTAVAGVETNLGLLDAIAAAPAFADARLDTGFLDRLLWQPSSADESLLAIAAGAVLRERAALAPPDPWHALPGWRLNAPAMQEVWLRHGGRLVMVPGEAAAVPDRAIVQTTPDAIYIVADGRRARLERHDPVAGTRVAAAAQGSLASAIPGVVKAVLVKAGQRVKRGAHLVVIEAMKLEVPIAAPDDGVVEKVLVSIADQVEEGKTLIAFRADSEQAAP
jgi:3-methylcrotonyl-CoA carboxylase alpha subunit